jgi:hypothetical protein
MHSRVANSQATLFNTRVAARSLPVLLSAHLILRAFYLQCFIVAEVPVLLSAHLILRALSSNALLWPKL